MLNSDDIVNLVMAECKKAGSPYKWAKKHKIKNIYMTLRGDRLPSTDILQVLGYRMVRGYVRVEKKR